MKGVKVSNVSATPLVPVSPVSSRGVLIGERCVDRCENVSCGAGECVNGWSRHICDCSQTLNSGTGCHECELESELANECFSLMTGKFNDTNLEIIHFCRRTSTDAIHKGRD